MSRYYSFQIINVLLVTTISGSVVNSIEEILPEPASTFSLLGGSLPRVCAFFCCYVFMKAFAGLPLELCRGVAAAHANIKRLIYRRLHNKTGSTLLGCEILRGRAGSPSASTAQDLVGRHDDGLRRGCPPWC